MNNNSPIAIALASPQGKRALWLLGLIAAAEATGFVLIAEGVARGVVAVMNSQPVGLALTLGLLGAALRALTVLLDRIVGTTAATGTKTTLRARLAQRALAGGGRDVRYSDGALTVLATRSLDDLDDYFTAVLPALLKSALIPALLVVRLLFTDLISACVIILCLPLVPVFMVLIGRYTQERVEHATLALDRLSANLVELARGLPVLVGLGRVRAQTAALVNISEEYRRTTMQTLKVAFLSALALELISTISVAMVAVFIGVRLVGGQMPLEAGLFALILAPECFTPLRRLGAAFHSTENGLAAYQRVTAVDAQRPAAPYGTGVSTPANPGLQAAGLAVQYAERPDPALTATDLHLPGTGLMVVTGGSGRGKSTLLGVVAGLIRPSDEVTIAGELTGVPTAIAYLPQAPHTCAVTIAEELRLYSGSHVATDYAQWLHTAGLHLEPDTPCAALSPGELRRLGFARVLAGCAAGAQLVLLDEPTAHLDEESADRIRQEISTLAAQLPVIVATHDAKLADSADTVLRLGGGLAEQPEDQLANQAEDQPALVTNEAQPTLGTNEAQPALATSPAQLPQTQQVQHTAASAEDSDAPASTGVTGSIEPAARDTSELPLTVLFARLARVVDIRSWKFVTAVLYGVCAVAAGIALTGVSAWLIVHASRQPPMMYLLVAIVGVRFFGLSRSVFRYLERLAIHEAILRSLTRLRERLWLHFAARGTADRTVLSGRTALTLLVADVDDIRDLAPRVVLPPIVALVISVACGVTMAIIAWPAFLVMLGLIGCALLIAPALTLVIDARASQHMRSARTSVLSRLAALLAAREDLAVNGVGRRVLSEFVAADRNACTLERRSLRAAGSGHALVTGACVAAGVLMLPLLAPAVAAGQLSGELLAVTVLIPIALIDVYVDALTAIQQWPALKAVLSRVDTLDQPAAQQPPHLNPPTSIESLRFEQLAARWPGMAAPVFSGLDARCDSSSWTVISGDSGSGKTTLVSIVLRFLTPVRGRYLLNERDALHYTPDDLAGTIAWCPQESHAFDSTLRGNLAIARGQDDAVSDADMLAVLKRVGLSELCTDQAGLGLRIGAGGSRISGGQRQRLAVARALLARAEVVVLDEPTAHLDAELAHTMMNDLRAGLDTETVLLVTHDAGLGHAGDRQIRLGAEGALQGSGRY